MLYAIIMEPSSITSSTASSDLHTIFTSNRDGFAILTSKQLPACATFTLQSALGPLAVSIAARPVHVQLADSKEIAQLRRFHEFVFRDVLNIVQPFLASDYENEQHSYLIVPTTCNGRSDVEIDWPLVREFQQPITLHGDCPEIDDTHMLTETDDESCEKTDNETDATITSATIGGKRSKRTFRAEDYRNRVVFPWYRIERSKRYAVVRVAEHLTPFSPFPNEKYESYAAYIEDRYQRPVLCREQFMLEVVCLPTNNNDLDALVQRTETKPSFGGDRGRGVEMLIPELCQNLGFPSAMWLRATLLPAVLHRLHGLQTAEWLRNMLNASEYADEQNGMNETNHLSGFPLILYFVCCHISSFIVLFLSC